MPLRPLGQYTSVLLSALKSTPSTLVNVVLAAATSILFNLSHWSNTKVPMVVTPPGIVIVVNPVDANALPFILVTEFGIVTPVSPVHW